MLTIPNLILNYVSDVVSGTSLSVDQMRVDEIAKLFLQKTLLYCGDWGSMSESKEIKHQYDLIMMSDTIYFVDYYPRLHKIIRQAIKPGGKL